MRENRTSGSEGGGPGNEPVLPTPICWKESVDFTSGAGGGGVLGAQGGRGLEIATSG